MPTSEPAPEVQFDDMPQQVRAGLMGMWVFLITELLPVSYTHLTLPTTPYV